MKRLAEFCCLPATSLIDDAIDIPEFIYLESKPAEDHYPRDAALDATPYNTFLK